MKGEEGNKASLGRRERGAIAANRGSLLQQQEQK